MSAVASAVSPVLPTGTRSNGESSAGQGSSGGEENKS
jgi:hypothetical protein